MCRSCVQSLCWFSLFLSFFLKIVLMALLFIISLRTFNSGGLYPSDYSPTLTNSHLTPSIDDKGRTMSKKFAFSVLIRISALTCIRSDDNVFSMWWQKTRRMLVIVIWMLMLAIKLILYTHTQKTIYAYLMCVVYVTQTHMFDMVVEN